MIAELLEHTPLVPLIQADDPEVALKTVKALQAGGLNVVEVVLRTEGAMKCLEAIARDAPGAVVGAGTVLTLEQAKAVVTRGAQFVVSPGLEEEIVAFCQSRSIDVLPGTVTATEVQRAWNLGLRVVKFFPAGLSGGPSMLWALSSVFRGMRFMPTGGVNADNLGQYMEVPAVLACGGSWMTPADEIHAGNYEAITQHARAALATARHYRPDGQGQAQR